MPKIRIDSTWDGWESTTDGGDQTFTITDPVTGEVIKTVDLLYVLVAFDGPPAGGNDYTVTSDHYVIAIDTGYSWDAYGDPLYYDPLGYNLISTTGASGDTDITDPFGDPGYSDSFLVYSWIYLGSTSVSIATSDQSPIIDSITPASADAGSSVSVTITGSWFGQNPVLEFSGDGLVTATVDYSTSTSTTIDATVHVGANATLGDRTVDVRSSGSSGLGFLAGPGKQAKSNPKTFTVKGGCQVTIANDGTKYSLGADYQTTTIPLRAESVCPGTVSWSLRFNYFTTGHKGTTTITKPAINEPAINDSLRASNQPGALNYQTPKGTGGRVDVTATITINGISTNQGVTFYVDGIAIPPSTINDRLIQLYAGGGTPHLMKGVAFAESQRRQFGYFGQQFALFGHAGLWPFESYGGGSHIGLMMVETNMVDAYDWQQNTFDGVNLFTNDKLKRAGTIESLYKKKYPKLRDLTLQESELDGLVFYGEGSTHVYVKCQKCALGINGAYWVPNANGTAWTVNTNNKVGVDYVKTVLGNMQ